MIPHHDHQCIQQIINSLNLSKICKHELNLSISIFLFELLKKYLVSINFTSWKCPYSGLFWSAIPCIWAEYGEIRSISLYSVRMQKSPDQNNFEYDTFYAVFRYFKVKVVSYFQFWLVMELCWVVFWLTGTRHRVAFEMCIQNSWPIKKKSKRGQ